MNLILARLMCAMENALKTVMYISESFTTLILKLHCRDIKFLEKEFKTFAENVLKNMKTFKLEGLGFHQNITKSS